MRVLWVFLGFLFLGLAAVGAVLPVLPTTPFLLLATGCFLRGSQRMHRWMMNNSLFGRYLASYAEGKGIPARVKMMAVAVLWTGIIISCIIVGSAAVAAILVVIASLVTFHIVRLPGAWQG